VGANGANGDVGSNGLDAGFAGGATRSRPFSIARIPAPAGTLSVRTDVFDRIVAAAAAARMQEIIAGTNQVEAAETFPACPCIRIGRVLSSRARELKARLAQ
jgi:hypothetical protein